MLKGKRGEVWLEGAFDAQGIGTVPDVKLERRLGVVDAPTLGQVERAVRAWLAL